MHEDLVLYVMHSNTARNGRRQAAKGLNRARLQGRASFVHSDLVSFSTIMSADADAILVVGGIESIDS